MTLRAFAIFLALLTLSAAPPQARPLTEACPAKQSRAEVALPMGAFAMVEVPGECLLLATLGTDDDKAGGVAVIDLNGGKPRVDHVIRTPTAAIGLVLSNDRRLAVAAGGDRIYVFNMPALIAGNRAALAGTLKYAEKPGTVSVALTPDEKLLFASDEGQGKITVLDFAQMRRSRFAKPKLLTSIPVDYAPTMLAMSADGRFLYVPVQGILRRRNPPVSCRSEGGNDPTPVNPVGAILTIDVSRAVSQPGAAVVSRAYAGCSPVRLSLSKDGKTLWVTNRLGDTVRALDVSKFATDPAHSEVAVVKVGHQPIGVALLRDDTIVAVANASRWEADQTSPKTVTAFSTAKALNGTADPQTIPVGVFPRDVSASADGETLYVSNFGSKTISLIPVSSLAKEAQR